MSDVIVRSAAALAVVQRGLSSLLSPERLDAALVLNGWAGELGLKSGISPQQHIDRFDTAVDAIVASDGGWSRQTKAAVKGVLDQYLANTLKFFAAAIGTDLAGCTNKGSVIARLVADEVVPVSWTSLDEYSDSYKAWQEAGPDAAPAGPGAPPGPPVGPSVQSVDPVGPAALPGPPLGPAVQSVDAVGPAALTGQPEAPFALSVPSIVPSAVGVTPADVSAALQDPSALAQILAGLANNGTARQSSLNNDTSPAADGSLGAAPLSPLDAHKEYVLKLLAAGRFVDPVSVDDESLHYLEFKVHFAPTTFESNANGQVMVRKASRLPDTSAIFDANRIFGGYSNMTEMCMLDTLNRFSSHTVGQMMQLLNTVRRIAWASEFSKGRFFKHFLLKHAGKADLMKAYTDDSQLSMEHLVMAAPPMPSRLSFPDVAQMPRNRGIKRAATGSSLASRSRGGPAVMSASSGREPRVRPSSDKPCKSRCDPGLTCTYPDCVFSHICVACGQNHPASACTSWDAAKGAAAMAPINTRRR
jgi:hypothetical protein